MPVGGYRYDRKLYQSGELSNDAFMILKDIVSLGYYLPVTVDIICLTRQQ